MPPRYTGGCQCGAVRYEISAEPVSTYVCHCTVCQSQSGSAFGMAIRVQSKHFRLLSGTLKSYMRKGESGRILECAFCPECGTRIYHVPQRFQDQKSVKPGTNVDMPTLLEQWIDAGRQVTTFPVHEYWLDIGRMEDFMRAQSEYGDFVK